MPDFIKLALSPASIQAMAQATKGFGSGAGSGGLAGAGLGAALGAFRGYKRQREEGDSVGGALAGGASRALRGAAQGALVGAGAGGVLGAARPGLAQAAARLPGFGSASRFGQRQVHALTGVGDAKYVRSIGGGAADAQERVQTARQGLHKVRGGARADIQSAQRELRSAKSGFEASERAEAMGLTSIPGYARALRKDPIAALKAGFGEQWANMGSGGGGALNRAFTYGLPAAGVAQALKGGDGKQGRFEAAGNAVGQGLGFAAGPLPIAASTLLAPAAGKALGTLGKGLDRMTGKLQPTRRPPPALEPGGGSTQPSEYVVSDRAAGVIPEGIGS